jgi:hypothetical protein
MYSTRASRLNTFASQTRKPSMTRVTLSVITMGLAVTILNTSSADAAIMQNSASARSPPTISTTTTPAGTFLDRDRIVPIDDPGVRRQQEVSPLPDSVGIER